MKYRELFDADIKIAMADDHQLFRDGIKEVIESTPMNFLIEATNGEELLQQLRLCSQAQLPNIVLLDINMPIMDGIATAEILRLEFPTINVLVLTMYTDERMVVTMLKCGVRGYLNKNVSKEELLSAIREVSQGKRYFSFSFSMLRWITSQGLQRHRP